MAGYFTPTAAANVQQWACICLATNLHPLRSFLLAPGLLSSMTANGATARVSTSFAWYNSSDGLDAGEERNRGQASGAYVFRCAGLAAGA